MRFRSKSFITFLLLVLIIGGFVYFIQNRNTDESATEEPTDNTSLFPTDENVTYNGRVNPNPYIPNGNSTFRNTLYNYEITFPNNLVVRSADPNSTGKPEESRSINLRYSADQNPGLSGIYITVKSNLKTSDIRSICRDCQNASALGRPCSHGFECPNESEIKTRDFKFNNLDWKRIDNLSVGYIPSGYLHYLLQIPDGVLVVYSPTLGNEILADTIVQGIKFSK